MRASIAKQSPTLAFRLTHLDDQSANNPWSNSYGANFSDEMTHRSIYRIFASANYEDTFGICSAIFYILRNKYRSSIYFYY
jgi:hypothetical protein